MQPLPSMQRMDTLPPTLDELNHCPPERFVALLVAVFEHAPWVAEAALPARPFSSVDALHAAMMATLHALPEPALLALLRGHPELAGAAARAGRMTRDSIDEQASLALEALGPDEAAQWDALNAAYRKRFGFPFILCIRRHSRSSALKAFGERLLNPRATELRNALAEIAAISRLRLAQRVHAAA